MVVKDDITNALRELEIKAGDCVLVHSSFKSLGKVDGGAETVIKGFLDVIEESGTLVFPTLVQKDFSNAYKTWHLDKDSDVGYLTNYFRKREGSVRSDQATHSVAATGRLAIELTKTHGHTAKRFGSMGDTPFAPDSPWEKMYKLNAKIVMLGVGPLYITFRHYAEYCYIEKCLKEIEEANEYSEMKSQLSDFNKPGVWPHLNNDILAKKLDDAGLVKKANCNEAKLLCFEAKSFVDTAIEHLTNGDADILRRNDDYWDTDAWIEWSKRFADIKNKLGG